MSWCINPLAPNVLHHIETSQLICISNQLTGFCMWGTVVVNGLMRSMNLNAIAVLNIYVVGYRSIINGISKSEAVSLIQNADLNHGSFISEIKWAPLKCLFWNANDWTVKFMVSITSDISLCYRLCYKNMINYNSTCWKPTAI